MMTDLAKEIAGVVAAAITAWLGWRNLALSREKHALERCAQGIDDLDQVRQALTEENERLRKRLDAAEKRIAELKHQVAVLEEKLEIDRALFEKMQAQINALKMRS